MTAPADPGASGNVRVVARIRPLAKYEIANGSKETTTSLSTLEQSFHDVHSPLNTDPELVQVQLVGGKKRWFELDAVFDKNSTQKEVYVRSGGKQSVCDDIFKGFNCTILAYGQTGAGKTFSMGTAAHGTEVGEMDGMIPRACHDLFEQIKLKCDGNAKVELSYLEIYNEELRDLLVDDDQTPLKIRETLDGEVYVSGLKSEEVKSPEDIGMLMEEASGRRKVAATAMNATSSRSHAMCVLRVQGVIEGPEGTDKFTSKLTLVDLAGSERIKKTGAQGSRVKEGININKSLMVLGQVVAALGEKDKRKKRKPPYRDSKLTRLLQDSLGGNSRTIMVACVSPADFNVDETVNTLRYATSARNIKNTATRNLVKNISQEEAAKLQRENQLLKQQVAELQAALKMMSEAPPISSNMSCVSDDNDDISIKSVDTSDADPQSRGSGTSDGKRVKELEKEVDRLKKEVKSAKNDICKSAAATAVELPAMKVEVAHLREEVDEKRILEEENNRLREELEEVKNDAECAQRAATKLSDIMDQLKNLSEEESERKRTQYEHLKKEEAWVHFVCQMLENNKEQIKKLSEDFALVVRVVESPMVMAVTNVPTNPAKPRNRRWWGGMADSLQEEANMSTSMHGRAQVYDPGLRHKLLTEHVEFFNDRMKEVECTIDSESVSLKEIRSSIRKDREKLQSEIGVNEFMKATLNKGDKDLLQQLTTMLIGPVKFVD